MNNDFLENPINIKDLPKESKFDLCLLENNEKQIGEICNFLQNEKKLMLINGFKGAGKSLIADFVTSNLNDKCLILKYNCLETTILDDLLLVFFNLFRSYIFQGKIFPPRIKTENFTQKINSYFHSVNLPIVVVLNSFELVLKSNKQDILNFVKHLTVLPNVKIIITSRKFVNEDFEDVEYEKSTILAFSPQIFEKFLRANGVKNIGVLSNELYKQSKGYYGCVNLAVKIMNLRNLSLVEFLENYSKSFIPFSEYVLREGLALVDPVNAHLYRLLTIMRVPIHVNLLKSLRLFNQERVKFFLENSILSADGECLYLKDSFREIIEHQIPDNVMIKLHSACVDLYNTQLPLKPLERDLLLSRQTMRNEIEYHSMFLPKKPILIKPVQEEKENSSISDASVELEKPKTSEVEVKEETKEEKINKISFIIEDESVLEGIADSITDFVTENVEKTQFAKQNNSLSLVQLLNQAKKEEQNYNYKYVVMLYQSALTKKDDDNFYQFLPTIYVKLAEAYKHLSQWYEALESYTQAQDFYFNISSKNKENEIKLEIANIYYIMYKYENAKYILNELETNPEITSDLRIRVNLALAKLEDNLNLEYEHYKNSLPLVTPETNKPLVSELYYKFAGLSDEKNDTKTAVQYYKKCIELDSNPRNNKYLSRALARIAELYDEIGNSKSAIRYYSKSMKIDTDMKNYNNLYSSSIHLAEIYLSIDKEKSLLYMQQALSYANKLKEPFYIADANLELGDYYFIRKDDKMAYKYFKNAYNVAKQFSSNDNLDKIETRIDEIRKRVSEKEFKEIQDENEK